jgi:hypothetical protein
MRSHTVQEARRGCGCNPVVVIVTHKPVTFAASFASMDKRPLLSFDFTIGATWLHAFFVYLINADHYRQSRLHIDHLYRCGICNNFYCS